MATPFRPGAVSSPPMRGLLRPAFNGICLLSLLACLSTAWEWRRSHHVYFAVFSPKEGLGPHILENAIVKYLSSGAPTLRAPWHSDDDSAVPFRVCDFWALVLATLRHRDLTIGFREPLEARDKKIAEVLR
jgi:hypothetical protein